MDSRSPFAPANLLNWLLLFVPVAAVLVALFVAPAPVLLSYAVGPAPMDLLLTRMEVPAVAVSVGIVALIARDGETNWLEGVLMLAVHAIPGMAFWFLPAPPP